MANYFAGVLTDGRVIAPHLYFSNGSGIEEARDAEGNTTNGLRSRCSIDYIKDWKEGRDIVYDNDGVTVAVILHQFNDPNSLNDITQNYRVDSLWYTRTGKIWRCTDSTEGSSAWVDETPVTLTQLLSVPTSHPLTPGVLWLDEGRVSVSLPWAASGGAWDDSGKWYDSQSWSE